MIIKDKIIINCPCCGQELLLQVEFSFERLFQYKTPSLGSIAMFNTGWPSSSWRDVSGIDLVDGDDCIGKSAERGSSICYSSFDNMQLWCDGCENFIDTQSASVITARVVDIDP